MCCVCVCAVKMNVDTSCLTDCKWLRVREFDCHRAEKVKTTSSEIESERKRSRHTRGAVKWMV